MKFILTLIALSVVVAWSACTSPTDVPANRRQDQDTTKTTHRSDSLRINPQVIDFGQTTLPTRIKRSIELRNLAPGDTFVVTSLELRNGGQVFWVDTTALPIMLIGTGDVTTTIEVTFAPKQAGTFWDTLCINGSTKHCALLVGGAVSLSSECKGINFIDLAVGEVRDIVVDITNTGTDPMTITSATISGPEAANFMIASLPATPMQISAGGTLSFTVRFAPDSRRTFQALLHFATTGGSSPLRDYCLSGKGI
jgi:hypothetical protein